MVDFVGRSGELALFSNGSDAAVVNTDLNLVVGVGEYSVLSATREWQATGEVVPTSTVELAASAVTTLDIKVITAAAGRAYTIPDSVKAEAQKALDWRKEHKRGGTPVGLNTARTLARGGQIGIEKLRHIAKYFPRHEVDKKGKGWKPGQDNFPSNGRIAWALWGGDAAWRWARAIVERENKKALAAGGYALPGYEDSLDTYKTAGSYDSNIDAFKMAHELDPEYGPEFMARVRMDGSGIDRLYKVDFDGKVCVWDGRGWDDLGHVEGDVWSYDRALDDEYDHVDKDHFIIDPESAVVISARLQEEPFRKVSLEDIDPDEAMMMADGLLDEDWQMVDYALTAAGDSMSGTKGSKPTGATKAGDGQYTAAERSNIAKGAPRDATGKFAKTGGRAVVGNNQATGAGTIVGRSKTPGNIMFKKDSDGQTIDVPAKYSTPEDQFKAPAAPVDFGAPLDTSGILGEPRTPKSMPNARLKGTLPPMSPADMQGILNDWPSYVQSQRESFTPTNEADARKYAKDTGQKVREVASTTRRPVTAVKEGKLVKQEIVATRQSAPGGDKSKQTLEGLKNRTAYTPRKFGDDNRDSLKARRFGDDNRDSLKSKTGGKLLAPLSGRKTTSSNTGGKLLAPLSGRKTSGGTGGRILAPLSGRKGTTVNPMPSQAADSRNAPGSNRNAVADPRNAPGSNRQTKPVASKPAATKSQFDDKGRYVVQKGDNLWSIAEKNKPKGQTTAQYWNKVLEANKGKFKSGNPSLIYSGERVTLPGKNVKPADSRNAPGSNRSTPIKPSDSRNAPGSNRSGVADSRNAPGSNRSVDKRNPADAGRYPGYTADQQKKKSDASKKMNADAKAYGQGKLAGIAKDKAQKSAKMNADAKEIGTAKLKAAAKVKAASNKRNADAKAYGQGIKSGIAQKRNADAKAYGQGIKSGVDKVKADNAKRNADAKALGEAKKAGIAKKRNDDAKAYGQGIMKGIAQDKARKAALDDKGRYVVKKGDSLWSIADKNKPSNESTAGYWAKVMKANPKENFKSGNPSLIYSGEKVNLPGAAKKADSRNAPGSNKSTPVKKADSRNAPGSNRNGAADSRNAPGSNASPKGPNKGDSRNAPGSNKNSSGDSRNAPGSNASPKGPAKGDSRNAPGSNKPSSGDSRNAPGSNKSPNKPGTPRPPQASDSRNAPGSNAPSKGDKRNAPGSNASPKKAAPKSAPAKQSQKNPIREALEGLKGRTAYKQETFKPKAEQRPATSANRPKLEQRPAAANRPKSEPIKRGKAGTRKRNLPEG